MSKTIIQVFNEQDFLKIKSLLIDKEYKFYENINSDTSFPTLQSSVIYGELIIEGILDDDILYEFSEKVKVIKHANEKSKSTTKKRIKQYLLFGYLILVTFFFIKYWYINYRNSEAKNYIYEWNFSGNRMYLKSKKTGEIISQYIDKNYNMNFEQVINYSVDGNIIMEYFDNNEDGYYEYSLNSTTESNFLSDFSDRNIDGYFDLLRFITENQDTIFIEFNYNKGYYRLDNWH